MSREAVAIVGIGCRFAGGADSPERFWELLVDGVDTVSKIPESRSELAACDGRASTPGKLSTPYGAFLDDVESFDAELFGISAREAVHVDPQQRLMLEVVWEAFEDSRLGVRTLRGCNAGVFLGLMSGDYEGLLAEQPDELAFYSLNGAGRYGLAGRISFFFGLEGPSLVVDTASSSSLAAVHLACQSLWSGESELAVAGGVQLFLTAELSVAASRGGILAADGRCKFADARADGFGRGEGAGAVVLKTARRALADGDRVYALIRGGATQHVGRSAEAMSAPSPAAQEALLRRAFRHAGVSADEIGYVEAHGTGTPAGDRAELTALGAVFSGRRGAACRVGSVKTNVGHTLGAAGAAGLIKLALCLHHRRIPKTLHFRRPPADLCYDEFGLRVQDEPTPWPPAAGPAIGGVSSFGLSGTNVHLVLEQAPPVADAVTVSSDDDPARHVLTLSARTRGALRELAKRYEAFLVSQPDVALADVCFTAGTGRSHFEHRLAVVAASPREARRRLRRWHAGNGSSDAVSGNVVPDRPPRVAFLFTGQGSQYVGMGRHLYETQPGFRRTLERCDEILRAELERPLLDVLYGDESSSLDETVYTQPVLFSLEYALAQLWRSWHVEPSALVGHSVGEYVAACVASVFSLEDGLRLIAERARRMQALPRAGAMAVVHAGEERVAETMRAVSAQVSIASVNGPENTVVSGPGPRVDEVLANFERQGVRTRKLRTSHAFHSSLMEPMLPAFARAAGEVAFSSPTIPLISNLTGEPVTGEVTSPEYWCRHVREPVRFARSMETLHRRGCEVFIEIGPDSTLLGMGRPCLPAGFGVWLPSLRRDEDGGRQILRSLAKVYTCGVSPEEALFHRYGSHRRLSLPLYPFQRERFRVSGSATAHDKTPEPGAEKPSMVKRLRSVTPDEREALLLEIVRNEVAGVLGFEEPWVPDPRRGFFDMGMDSFMVVELSRRLETGLKRQFSSTLLFKYTNVEDLCGYLLRDLFESETEDVSRKTPSAISARARLEAIERARSEPLAIVGLGCRFPADAEDPARFWQLLHDGVDAVTQIPRDRWDVDAWYDPDPDAPGKSYVRHGGFLREVDRFDAEFFGISPREAAAMDPQQRLLLEVSWEALENAGLPPHGLRGSRTGVFVGLTSVDFAYLSIDPWNPETIDAYSTWGTDRGVAAGRIAFVLGLQGPVLQLDTACSSSLVAVHQACQSLRSGECDLALAGGVNLVLSPVTTIGRCRMKALARDGRCKTFDASADGYVQGEGCGLVVLERLSDALAGRDTVLALIRGSAINHDGPASGLTVPNEGAQEKLIRQALENAGVAPSEVGYVETHGSGTSLGDPIEVGALGAVFARGRPRDLPLRIGSVKTNVGHLEAAAGIASLVKVVLALRQEEIPPHLHLDRPNPHIPWDELPIEVPTARTPWPAGDRRRVAGVSSFGMSGTNAHVVVEEGPSRKPTEAAARRPLHLLVLSAKTAPALADLANRYREHLLSSPEPRFEDVCFTAGVGRSHFSYRLSVWAGSAAEAGEKLGAFARAEEPAGLTTCRVEDEKPRKVAFLFSGHGAEYVGMGRQLYETQPVARQVLDRCDELLRPRLDLPLLEAMYPTGEESPIPCDVVYTHAALFAVGSALTELWKSWGIRPDVVMGHSLGEYVAARAAGVFSLEDGLELVVERARLMRSATLEGEMAVISADEPLVRAAIEPHLKEASIAAVNGPDSFVVSGASRAVVEICSKLEGRGARINRLNIDRASHSPMMEPMLAAFEKVASGIDYSRPRTKIVSNMTGELVEDQIATPRYWVRHARQPVNFAAGIGALEALGYEIFLEIGPKPVLLTLAQSCLPQGTGLCLPSLRPNREDWEQLLESLGELYVHGVAVDWEGFNRDRQARRTALPTYPFQRRGYPLAKAGARHGASRYEPPAREENVIARIYNVLSDIQLDAGGEHLGKDFLTFAPFPEIVEGFSWGAAICDPQSSAAGYYSYLVDAQREMRNVLLRHVDFSSRGKVLDFGCGYASDLLELTGKYGHLEGCGYTLSNKQAEIGDREARRRGLHDRLRIFNRDSTKDDFPDEYDLALGFEVAVLIEDKRALFSNLDRHMTDGGLVLLADFISHAEFSIEHDPASSYLVTAEEWSELFSENHMRVVECVDVSREIANFLHDPDFEENLEKIERIRRSADVKEALLAYHQMYQLLRKKLVSYVLLTIEKNESFSTGKARGLSRSALDSPIPYSEVALSTWLYELAWHPHSLGEPSPVTEPATGRWLVFADGARSETNLVELLENQGDSVALVPPTDPEHFGRLFEEEVADRELPPWKGVVAALEDCESVLRLVQALAGAPRSFQQARLWILTHAAVPLPDDVAPPNVSQAVLWGMARSVALEYPRIWGGIVDLSAEPKAREAERLLSCLNRPDGEDQVALRGERGWVPRLVRKPRFPQGDEPRPESDEIELCPQSTYLVTGGLGTMGLEVGRWLAARGARHLALISRRGASKAALESVRELERLGCRVLVAQADVAEKAHVTRVLQEIDASGSPLRGIFHLAGIFGYEAVADMEPDTLHAVLRPKVEGTWILHESTLDRELDCFVCFSSIYSLLGSAKQAHYTAANSFLDAFSHYRRSLGLPALTVNWGRWPDGMLPAGLEASLDLMGVAPLPARQAIEALDVFLSSGTTQAMVGKIDWPTFKEFYESSGARPLLEKIDTTSWDPVEETARVASSFSRRLRQSSASEQRNALTEYLRKEIARVLGLGSVGKPEVRQKLFSLGLDSLMAVELKKRIGKDLGIFLDNKKILGDFTAADLAVELSRQLALGEQDDRDWVEGEL